MRRSVFLAVWLGLVLSLLKESSAGNESAPDPTEMSLSEPPESSTGNESAPDPTETSLSELTEPSADNEADPDTTETSPSEMTETTAETSASPSETPTTAPPETTAETSASPSETPTTAPPESSTLKVTSPDPIVTTTSTPTVVGDFCHGDPCGGNSAKCISLNSSYTCECQYGFYYSNENCYGGQVYPATIAVRAPYSDSLKIVNSTEYEDVFKKVSEFFKSAFDHQLTGYIQTVIMKILPLKESRNSDSLMVTVTNLFTKNSTLNDTIVYSAVKNAIKDETVQYVYSYDVASHCDAYRCDAKTTECQNGIPPECKCKPGLAKTEWDDLSCSACSNSCSAREHKYCVKEEEGPVCKCMTNFKKENGNCVACPVGYSGEDCSDNSELILIIVGTVFGAIILSLVIAVSIISVRAKHKQNPEKRSLIKPGYSDMNTSEERPSMFPRVQTTSGHANPGYQPNNPYEMRSTNRDHFPERDYDDLYEMSREPRGFRMQSRY